MASILRSTVAGRGFSKAGAALWTIQVLLALLFLFAGGMKLVMPMDEMAGQMPFPIWFLQFIGVAEVLGALGLVLPGLLRIRVELTPLAAAGLVLIMVGATTLMLGSGDLASALVPFVVGLLSASVAYSRRHLLVRRSASRRLVLQPAT
jgi:hypothetical protein